MMDLIAFIAGLIIGGTWWLWGLLLGLITAVLFMLKSKGAIVPILLGLLSNPVFYLSAVGLVIVNTLASAYLRETIEA